MRFAVDDWDNNILPEEMTPNQRRSQVLGRTKLDAYEESVTAAGGEPYKLQSPARIPEIERLTRIMDGEEDLEFPEGTVVTKEFLADITFVSYMMGETGKSKNEILGDYPRIKNDFIKKHQAISLPTALRKEWDGRIGRYETADKMNKWASDGAVLGTSRWDSYAGFLEKNPDVKGSVELNEHFNSVWGRNKFMYTRHKKIFDTFTEKAIAATEKPRVVSMRDASAALAEIPKHLQPAALRYADQQTEGRLDFGSLFLITTGAQAQGFFGLSPTQQLDNSRKLASAIARGENILIGGGALEKGTSPFDAAVIVNRALSKNLSFSISGILSLPTQIVSRLAKREATLEERDIVFKSAQQAAQFWDATSTVENFVRGKVTDLSDIDSAFLRGTIEKAVFPTIESIPVMAVFAAAAFGGNKTAAVSGAKGLAARLIAGTTVGIAVRGTYHRSNFDELRAKNPDADIGALYLVAGGASVPQAAIGAFQMGFISRFIPGLSKFTKAITSPAHVNKVFRNFVIGTAATGSIEFAEEMTETFLLLTAQKLGSIISDKVPNIDLMDSIFDRIRTDSIDVLLGTSIFAAMGGGGNVIVKEQVRRNFLTREKAMGLYVDKETIAQIKEAKTFGAKERIFEENFDPDFAVEQINKAGAEGKTSADFMTDEEIKVTNQVNESRKRGTRIEPVVNTIVDDFGEIVGYSILTPDGKTEVHDTQESATLRLEDWYEENGLAPEVEAEPAAVEGEIEKAAISQITPVPKGTDISPQFKTFPKSGTITVGRKGAGGLFFGNNIENIDATVDLPVSGKGVRVIEGIDHEGNELGAPFPVILEAKEAGAIDFPDASPRIKKIIERIKKKFGSNADAQLSDTMGDLVVAIQAKEGGIEVIHMPALSDPSLVISVDLRNFDVEQAFKELELRIAGVKFPRGPLGILGERQALPEAAKLAPIAPVTDGTAKTPEENAERQGDDIETEEDFSGKTKTSVSQKVDQAKETRPSLNSETVEVKNAFLEKYLKRLGKDLPIKTMSTWKGQMLEVLQNKNWFAQAQERVRELMSKDRVDTIHIHDHPMLLLFGRQLIINRNAQEQVLANAIPDGIESQIKIAQSELQAIEDLIEHTNRALLKLGTPAGQILNQRQMALDVQDTGSFETLRRSYRLRIGKDPSGKDADALNEIAKKLDNKTKQKIKVLDKAATKFTKTNIKRSKEGFNFVKQQVKKAKTPKSDRDKILNKIKKQAQKRNWCIGGKVV